MPRRPARRPLAPPGSNRFHGRIIAPLVARAEELGLRCDHWFTGLAVEATDFADFHHLPCLSYRETCAILRHALASLPGSGHGLELGARQTLAEFDVLGLAMLASPTFGDALRTGIRYAPITGVMFALAMDEERAGIAITLHMYEHDPQLQPYLCEELISSCMNLCRAMLGDGFQPARVDLAYPPPPHAERYMQLFGPNVQFGCHENRIVIAHRWLPTPMPAANPNAVRQMTAVCAAEMPPGHAASSLAATIEQRLWQRLANPPRLQELAAELHMTERTLRRQLQAEDDSYRALLDRLRERAASRLLRERVLPLGQVAAAVGFADVRDFRRAFKRWTGQLPGQLRHGQRPAADAPAQPSTITPSTSNAAPRGSADAWMVERAG